MGPADAASSLCVAIYRATGNDFLAGVADTVIVKPAKVLLIVLRALVVTPARRPCHQALRGVVKTLPSAQFKDARHLRARIKSALDETGIDIPFPERDVWHRSQDGRQQSEER